MTSRSKPVTLGGRTFSTRTELQRYISAELQNATVGERVADDLRDVLLDLLASHPDADRKIGPGVDGFTVERNTVGSSNGFYIERVDGTSIDFSYRKCLDNISPIGFVEREVKKILRELVRSSILAFRESLEDVVICAFTMRSMRRDHAHIDHAFPNTFSAIVKKFLVSERLTWATFPIGYSGDPVIGRVVTDDGVRERWCKFHDANAHLRPIDPEINVKIGDADPYLHPDVLVSFADFIETNRQACEHLDNNDELREQREFMLPIIREVMHAHPDELERIESGHKWLSKLNEDADHLSTWFSWIMPGQERAA